ncbi:carbonic anhydrase [Streptomyces sp. IBSBF 3136]|uniref:carbonic anhydrase n=1 Tax=Streptomyces sp. IBSBF 3136 TaxID=2903524 RepID=UPI003FA7B609
MAPSQQPFAVMFGCYDSRPAAEIIFDRGLGDLFVVRTAGHVMGPEVLGSIECGVDVLGCPLVVVLGHDSCGAACAALEDGMTPAAYIRDVVERVTPSVLAARAAGRVEPEDVLTEHIAGPRGAPEAVGDRQSQPLLHRQGCGDQVAPLRVESAQDPVQPSRVGGHRPGHHHHGVCLHRSVGEGGRQKEAHPVPQLLRELRFGDDLRG